MISRRNVMQWGAAGGLALAAGGAHAADDVIQALIRVKWNRLLTPVWINGHGPIDFGIDTGAAIYTIDRTLAEQMKLPQTRLVGVHGVVDPEGDANPALREVAVDEVTIGGAFRERGVEMAEAGFRGDIVSGFVPGTLFTFAPTELNFPDGQARIYQTGRPSTEGYIRASLFVSTVPGSTRQIRDPHLPIDVQIDGQTYRLLIDTGAGSLITLLPQAVASRRLWKPGGIDVRGSGLTGRYDGRLVRFKTLTVAGHTLPDPVVEVIDPSTPHSPSEFDGLIGMEAMRRFGIVIDANEQSIWLKPNLTFPQAQRYNRSGFSIRRDAVSHITPGSAAEKAGMAVGDKVLIPNTGRDSVRAFHWALQDTPGSVVEFAVNRGGTRMPIRLVLQDLI